MPVHRSPAKCIGVEEHLCPQVLLHWFGVPIDGDIDAKVSCSVMVLVDWDGLLGVILCQQ